MVKHMLFLKWWLFMAAVTALGAFFATQGGIGRSMGAGPDEAELSSFAYIHPYVSLVWL